MTRTQHIPTHYIIVPDGMSFDGHDESTLRPSFVYRHALDYALGIARDGDCLYLAPANCCRGKSEHTLAYDYLISQPPARRLQLYCPPISFSDYVDTCGNATLLKQLLGDTIIHTPCELVCGYIHSYRAAYCFRKAGFTIHKVHRVPYRTTGEKIVRRWWYYNYKPIHYVYEMFALIRDIVLHTARQL